MGRKPYNLVHRCKFLDGGRTPVLTASDYVQDGLILQLDGIEKGRDPLKWQNLVGGESIDIVRSQSQNDAVKLPPSVNNIMPIHSNDYTVEYCFNKNNVASVSNFRFINPSSNNQYMLRYASRNNWQYYHASSAQNAFRIQAWKEPKTTICFTDEFCIANANKITEKTHIGTALAEQPAMGVSGNEYIMYAIRVYNRKLTDDEILYNQRVDNVRFNLGLNLNGGIQPYTPGRELTMSRNLALDEASPLESFEEPQTTEQEECVNVTER